MKDGSEFQTNYLNINLVIKVDFKKHLIVIPSKMRKMLMRKYNNHINQGKE